MTEMKTGDAAKPKMELTPVEKKRLGLRQFFDRQKPELSKLLPKSMSMDRFFRLALTECVKQPALLECSMESWALAMQKCAAQGLYPDGDLGFMYLIASNNSKKVGDKWVKTMEVRAQRGYQGDIQLARNSGEVVNIYADVVYEKDVYTIKKGLNPTLEHEPYEPRNDEDTPGALRAAYAVAKLTSGEIVWVNLWKFDVMRHKASSQSTGDNSPWTKHEAAMWKKSAIKELAKWLPKATEKMQDAMRDDDDHSQAIDITTLSLPDPGPQKTPTEALKDKLKGAAPEPEGEPLSDGVQAAEDVQAEQQGDEVTGDILPDGDPVCACTEPKGKVGEACESCTLKIAERKVAPAAASKKPAPKMVR